jgi:pimeloyl-ACP methyl ester carboxylesterase
MPGVGESRLRYGADSWRLLSGVLDALRDRADVTRTYALALSFGGHLALRCAIGDERLRGVVTAGAPVGAFFTDPLWQRRVPRVTVDTLAHLTGTAPGEVFGHIRGWALGGEPLAALRIPVAYLASRRDEIIPQAEVRLLRRHVRELTVMENDDVHGSPRHTAESGLWAVTSVLRMRGVRDPRTFALGVALRLLRARGRLRRGS